MNKKKQAFINKCIKTMHLFNNIPIYLHNYRVFFSRTLCYSMSIERRPPVLEQPAQRPRQRVGVLAAQPVALLAATGG